MILVSVCASVHPNKSRQTHSNRVKEVAFHIFRYNYAYRPSILILKRLAESSEHADSESISFFFKFSLLKNSKAVKKMIKILCYDMIRTAWLSESTSLCKTSEQGL
jgi:hypothetical protein